MMNCPTVELTFVHYLNEPFWSFSEIMNVINHLELIGIKHPYSFITSALKGQEINIMLEKPLKRKINGNKREIYVQYDHKKHVLDSIE